MLPPDLLLDPGLAVVLSGSWIAVDAEGEVAQMLTGEAGALPVGVERRDPVHTELAHALAVLSRRGALRAAAGAERPSERVLVADRPSVYAAVGAVPAGWLPLAPDLAMSRAPLSPREASAAREAAGAAGVFALDALLPPCFVVCEHVPFLYRRLDPLEALEPVRWSALPVELRDRVAAVFLPVPFSARVDLAAHFQLADLQLAGAVEDALDAASLVRPRPDGLDEVARRYLRPPVEPDGEPVWWFPLPVAPGRVALPSV